MINILIADDHAFFADGVTQALRGTEINVLKYIPKAEDIIDTVLDYKPDVLLCDIRFGDSLNGLDTLEKLMRIQPEAKVILFSQFDQQKMISESYARGAKAFLSKSVSSDVLIDAIRKVYKGELYFTAENAIKLAHMNYGKERPTDIREILDEREIKILQMIGDGKTEKEVAVALGCSPKTINIAKSEIKQKLNIDNLASMTKVALKFGLINPE